MEMKPISLGWVDGGYKTNKEELLESIVILSELQQKFEKEKRDLHYLITRHTVLSKQSHALSLAILSIEYVLLKEEPDLDLDFEMRAIRETTKTKGE